MKKQIINEGRFIDLAIVLLMAKKFILPFRKWKAYKLGLIDEKGHRTKKKARTSEEKNAYTHLDKMIRKIRVFVGDRWFLKLSLAYLLMKENKDDTSDFDLLVEQDEGLEIRKTVPLSSKENLIFRYKDKGFTFSFFIITDFTDMDDSKIITSSFGSSNIPKMGNEDLFKDLNEIFTNLFTGGEDIFEVMDENKEDSIVTVNYSQAELKIESTFNELTLGKLYTTFLSTKVTQDVQNTWEEFFEEI